MRSRLLVTLVLWVISSALFAESGKICSDAFRDIGSRSQSVSDRLLGNAPSGAIFNPDLPGQTGLRPPARPTGKRHRGISSAPKDGDAVVNRARPLLAAKGYEVVKRLGTGGQGTAILVTKNGEQFVIKVSRDFPRLLYSEAALTERARKGGEGDTRGESPYFSKAHVMELTDDGKNPALVATFFPRAPGSTDEAPSLQDRLNAGGLTLPMKYKIADQILRAIEIAHERGVIHRDLKPENILVDDAGNVRIIDFGLSAEKGKAPPGLETMITGTTEYMSPNQWISGPAEVGDDLHAARRVLWRLFATGVKGRNGGTPTDHEIERSFMGSDFTDIAHAPEAFVPPLFAMALWSRLPTSAKEQRELMEAARFKSPKEYQRLYARKLAAQTPVVGTATGWFNRKYKVDINYFGARDILASKEAIKNFPSGLSSKERDAIIRGYFALDRNAEQLKETQAPVSPLGESPALYFSEFRDRLDKLQGQWRARSDSYYLNGVP